MDQTKMDRRAFLARSVSCTAGLTLLAFPGMTGVLAAAGDKSKADIFKELDAMADKFMVMHRSCALGSFCALNEQFQLNADNKTIRALMPFTGGIASKGETCGAVSGSLLAIGFVFESATQQEQGKTGSSMKYGGMFFDRFKEAFGSTRCKGVQKHQFGRSYDFGNPEEMALFMEAAKSGKCFEVVRKAVRIAADIILENS